MTLFQGPAHLVRWAALALSIVTTASGAEWQPNRRPAEPRTLPAVGAKPLTAEPTKTGILVRNPRAERGEPEFALLDSYGRVKRYVEGSERVSLDSYVGQQVRILHDTGKTLLASQLELPLSSTRRSATNQGDAQQTAHFSNPRSRRRLVRLAAEEIPTTEKAPIVLEDVLTEEEKRGAAMSVEQLPPMEGELPHEVMSGPMMHDGPSYDGAAYGPEMSGEFVEDEYIPYGEGGCPHCQSGQCQGGGCRGGLCGLGSRWGGGGCSCGRCQNDVDYLSCCPGSRGRFYGRAEYLLWWFDEMYIPPLVTGSTVTNNEGVLGFSTATKVFWAAAATACGSRSACFWTSSVTSRFRPTICSLKRKVRASRRAG